MISINGSIHAAAFITFLNQMLTKHLPGDLAALKYLVYALILILPIIFNNAPAMRGVRERISPKRLLARFRRRKESDAVDDSASWDRIPTKIPMDELLSVDLKAPDETPDITMPEDENK